MMGSLYASDSNVKGLKYQTYQIVKLFFRGVGKRSKSVFWRSARPLPVNSNPLSYENRVAYTGITRRLRCL